MSEFKLEPLICIAHYDAEWTSLDEWGICHVAGPAGPTVWDDLLRAAESRPEDYTKDDGYVVNAEEIDPLTGVSARREQWDGLYRDQVSRMVMYVQRLQETGANLASDPVT